MQTMGATVTTVPSEVDSAVPGEVDSSSTKPSEATLKAKRSFGIPFWCFAGWIGLVVIAAIFGKRLPFADKEVDYLGSALINDGKPWDTFGSKHLLGLDPNGNDWLSAIILGARNSMIIAFATIAFGFIVGGGL